jgi:Ca2+-binding EF-hand superfamily protein
MKKLLPLAFAFACTLPLAATAQTAQPELTPEHFAQLDRNKSGGVSKEEYEQFMIESFSKLDTDRNLRLSKAEAAKVLSPEQFALVDKDNSGDITLDEFIEHVSRDFDRWDLNKDGQLQP